MTGFFDGWCGLLDSPDWRAVSNWQRRAYPAAFSARTTQMCRGGGIAKDRVGDGQLRADYALYSVLGAGNLKTYDSGQSHIVGESQGRHPYLRRSRDQSLYAASTA